MPDAGNCLVLYAVCRRQRVQRSAVVLHVLHDATVTDGAVAAVRTLLVARTEAAVDAGAAQTATADAVVCAAR